MRRGLIVFNYNQASSEAPSIRLKQVTGTWFIVQEVSRDQQKKILSSLSIQKQKRVQYISEKGCPWYPQNALLKWL